MLGVRGATLPLRLHGGSGIRTQKSEALLAQVDHGGFFFIIDFNLHLADSSLSRFSTAPTSQSVLL